MLIPLLLFIVYDKTEPALPSCLNLYLGPFSSLEVINSRKINNSFREIPSLSSDIASDYDGGCCVHKNSLGDLHFMPRIRPLIVQRRSLWLCRWTRFKADDKVKRPIGMDDYGDQNRPEYGPKEGLVVVRVVIMTMIIMVKIDWGSWRDGSWGRAEKERRWSTQPLLLYWDARGGKSAAQQLPIKFLTRCIPPSDSERAQKIRRSRMGSSMQEERRLHFVQMLFYS